MKIAENKRIAVTGIGPISSLGIGKKDFWDNLYNCRLNVKEVEVRLSGKKWVKFFKHKVNNIDISNFGLDKGLLDEIKTWKEGEIDRDLNGLAAAIALAIKDSGLSYDEENNEIGLIVSHENPGLEQYFSKFLEVARHFFSSNKNASAVNYYDFMIKKMMKSSFELQTFMPLFHLAKLFGVHGYTLFINNACASGAYAFEEARRLIQVDKCDAVILVASDFPDVYKYIWFDVLKMHSANGISRPFSKNSNGFVMGDGATGIVLERMSNAKKRGAHIYAEYSGGACLSEGWKVSLPNVSSKCYEKTMRKALKIAGIKADSLDLIIPHGVGTNVSDRYEDMSIKDTFEKYYSKIPAVALKPYFGHNLGGNVLLETAALMMMFENDTILPTLNIQKENLLGKLNLRVKPLKTKIDYAMKSTCAFAGFNSALIFKRSK